MKLLLLQVVPSDGYILSTDDSTLAVAYKKSAVSGRAMSAGFRKYDIKMSFSTKLYYYDQQKRRRKKVNFIFSFLINYI